MVGSSLLMCAASVAKKEPHFIPDCAPVILTFKLELDKVEMNQGFIISGSAIIVQKLLSCCHD